MKKRFTVKNCSQIHENEQIGTPDETENQIDLFAFAGYILRHKRLIFIVVLLVMFIAAVKVISQPKMYASQASILPSGQADKLDKIKELAGLGGSMDSDENSSALFPVILRSHLIQDTVLSRKYTIAQNGNQITRTFQDYFGTDNPDDLRFSLAGITSISEDIGSGVIYLSIETDSPDFSQAILQNYLKELEAYNLNKRRSRAKENIKYLQRELVSGADNLRRAEDSLEAYQMANRNWNSTSDPEVIKSLSRLQRDIEVKTRMYTFLIEQYEIAKLDVQKDIPIVRILDKPSLPINSSGPKVRSTVLLSGVVALICMIITIIAYENLRKRSRGNDLESFETLRNDIESAFPRSIKIVNRIGQFRKKEASLVGD